MHKKNDFGIIKWERVQIKTQLPIYYSLSPEFSTVMATWPLEFELGFPISFSAKCNKLILSGSLRSFQHYLGLLR